MPCLSWIAAKSPFSYFVYIFLMAMPKFMPLNISRLHTQKAFSTFSLPSQA